MTSAERKARTVQLGFLAFHLACLGALLTGVSTVALGVAIGMYVLRAFGVTAGYHRLLAHRSFQTSRAMRFVLASLGSLAVQGSPLWWVGHHRNHHRHTETPKDLHSPAQHGFWYAHMGWMMDKACFEGTARHAKDLYRLPEIRLLHRCYPLLVLLEGATMFAFGALLNTAYPELGTSGTQMLIWGFFISTVALWHATFMVNSVCHCWGNRAYDARDTSTNNWLVALLTLGEGWHNNHHHFAYSARHGLRWWQLDLTWLALRLCEWIGLVWDLRVPRETVPTAWPPKAVAPSS